MPRGDRIPVTHAAWPCAGSPGITVTGEALARRNGASDQPRLGEPEPEPLDGRSIVPATSDAWARMDGNSAVPGKPGANMAGSTPIDHDEMPPSPSPATPDRLNGGGRCTPSGMPPGCSTGGPAGAGCELRATSSAMSEAGLPERRHMLRRAGAAPGLRAGFKAAAGTCGGDSATAAGAAVKPRAGAVAAACSACCAVRVDRRVRARGGVDVSERRRWCDIGAVARGVSGCVCARRGAAQSRRNTGRCITFLLRVCSAASPSSSLSSSSAAVPPARSCGFEGESETLSRRLIQGDTRLVAGHARAHVLVQPSRGCSDQFHGIRGTKQAQVTLLIPNAHGHLDAAEDAQFHRLLENRFSPLRERAL